MMACSRCSEREGGSMVRCNTGEEPILRVAILAELGGVAMLIHVVVQIYVWCKRVDEVGLPLFEDACIVFCLVSLCGMLCMFYCVLSFCVIFVWK